MIIFLY